MLGEQSLCLALLGCVTVRTELNFLINGKVTFEGKECVKDVGLHNSFNYTVA